jgi:hypothetical protein
MQEAEVSVRNQMKNRKGSDAFVTSARMVAYNKLMGLSVASAYRQPVVFGDNEVQRQAERDKKLGKPKPPVMPKLKPLDPSLFGG